MICYFFFSLFHCSNIYEGKTKAIEPWYGTHYTVETISDETITLWTTHTKQHPLYLPSVNQFIPSNFEIIGTKKENPVSSSFLREKKT